MTAMPRRLVLDPVALVGLLLVGGVWLSGVATVPLTLRENVLYHTEPIGEIRGEQSVGQTFLAPYNGLYRIDVSLADYGRVNTGLLYLRVLAQPGGDVLAEQVLAAESIRGDVMHSFEFPALSNSAGQQYYLELSAPDGDEGNAITAYIQPSAPYSDGEAYWAGQPAGGDLVFILHFRVSGWERARILLDQMIAGKPAAWGEAWYYLLLTSGYVAFSMALLWTLRRVSIS